MTECNEDVGTRLRNLLSQSKENPKKSNPKLISAAVLIPFVCIENEWHVLLTKRTNGVASHRGEISFPGGAAEEIDQNLIATALRETEEEIGISSSFIEVLGVLDPVETISHYFILPVVGIIQWPTVINPNHDEVEKVLFYSWDWLMDDSHWSEFDFSLDGKHPHKVIQYQGHQGEILWGITARIVQNVVRTLK